MVERLGLETGTFGEEQGPLGTSAWAKLISPQGEVLAYAVGADEDDAAREAASFYGVIMIVSGDPLDSKQGDPI